MIPTSFNTYFEQINLDNNFITEYSEKSDSRLYITSNISPETTPEEQNFYVLPHYIRQNTVQSGQDDLVNLFQTRDPHQINPLYPQLKKLEDTLGDNKMVEEAKQKWQEVCKGGYNKEVSNNTNVLEILQPYVLIFKKLFSQLV